MTQRDRDRQVALGWIAGQLSWENRLQALRSEEPAAEEETSGEVEPAA